MINSIFLASIENETQEYFRNKFQGWETAIDEFYIADKLNKKESAKYSFEEYLEKISHAKFGVCMRGNGPKCYREVEYAAFGTPLIITEGIDTNYPVPLIEGTHYFLAKNKEDIEKYAKETDEKTWQKMSLAVRKWYIENFTTEAMFNHLKDKIEALDLSQKKPSTVLIEPVDHEQYKLTYDSCKIFNPNINIVKTKEVNISGVTLKAGDIVINELPYLKTKASYKYKASKDELEGLRDIILKSNLQKNKDLATLMKWRLRNYKVEISKQGQKISPEAFIDEFGALRKIDEIKIQIATDFSFQRIVNAKYSNEEFELENNEIFPPIIIISAKLKFKIHDITYENMLTKELAEFFACKKMLPTEFDCYKALKLWEFEDAKEFNLTIKYLDSGSEQIVNYTDIRWH
jgi:hypothetical protein